MMMEEMRSHLAWALGVSLLVQVYAANRASGHTDAEWGPVAILYLGGPILFLVYVAFPFSYFTRFAIVDQLSETAALDTGGLRHDEVTKRLGLDVDRYSCPLVRRGTSAASAGQAVLSRRRVACASARAARSLLVRASEAASRRARMTGCEARRRRRLEIVLVTVRGCVYGSSLTELATAPTSCF